MINIIKSNRVMKKLISCIALFACIFTYTGCNEMEDDGSRGFMSDATIVGDSENGYYCYLDHGGLVISYSRELADKERGYFSFNYMENDWTTAPNGLKYIDNAHVYASQEYDVIHPITQKEAEAKHITDKDSCFVPSFLSVDYPSNGYFDINARFATVIKEKEENIYGEVNIVYDAAKQDPDTLRLQLCYNPHIPDGWSKVGNISRTVSCDISSLASLQQWNDSVTIVIDDADKGQYIRKIRKNDFLKPTVKVD